MDIAALSIAMANQQVRNNAGIAVMNNAKEMMEQQGSQLIKMLEQPAQSAPHPTAGSRIDIKI
ncbi:putative motility protein [Virgibacillus profundi]|uniref:Putative motility protein n=1 Tax=Virgibacillus profundi TaxID=2024555 RepID=A0A2A2IHR6_9BACI|nr:YjfB family protein [Virgibacillus profundi]PAV31329.1 putative motility protein [Virgibacillus profundi]PXY55514.1 putative motility protein [Virgibacillus profundi]